MSLLRGTAGAISVQLVSKAFAGLDQLLFALFAIGGGAGIQIKVDPQTQACHEKRAFLLTNQLG